MTDDKKNGGPTSLLESVTALLNSAEGEATPTEPIVASIDPPDEGPLEIYVQNSSAWGKELLGKPTSDGHTFTIGQAGCLLTCLCIAYTLLTRVRLTPEAANRMLKEKGAFLGPLLIVEKAAALLGLLAPDSLRYRGTTKDHGAPEAEAADDAFDGGKICIFHVDLNVDKAGDIYGDHFVVAFDRKDGVYLCADPAPGAVFEINAQTMVGESTWVHEHFTHDENGQPVNHAAVVKHMKVVGVIPVSLPRKEAA